jgi:hypothetical protein
MRDLNISHFSSVMFTWEEWGSELNNNYVWIPVKTLCSISIDTIYQGILLYTLFRHIVL